VSFLRVRHAYYCKVRAWARTHRGAILLQQRIAVLGECWSFVHCDRFAMVKEANRLEGTSKSKGKRKAEEIEDEDELEAATRPVKKVRQEVELRKERIKKRAAVGIAASLALG
jgi:hypothetical protein